MRIAIMGTRGIPASYGGFETLAEELGTRLVERGHDVTVYGRRHVVRWSEPYYRGVRLVILPSVQHKYLDTPVHTLLSVLHSLGQRYDAVIMCNAANALFIGVLRLGQTPCALNVDGIDRLRKKWSAIGRGWFLIGEWLATRLPQVIISDAEVMRQYYLKKYNADSQMIPYGADMRIADTAESLDRLRLRPREYILVVTRLEPENNADLVIRALGMVKTTMQLVIVGDAPYSSEYKLLLQRLAAEDERVLLAGAVYGSGYRELISNAYCFVQATEVGGTHPALIEAMAVGNLVVANDTPENAEVVGDAGILYARNDVASLRQWLQWAVDHPNDLDAYRSAARARMESCYSWDVVTDAYEALMLRLLQ